MAWLLGIDEAGYGPNLGPLVMTCVACRVPDELAAADLWAVLEEVVCRQPAAKERRVVVNDSKVVHAASNGLRTLERNTLAALPPDPLALCLREYHQGLCCGSSTLHAEPWYTGASRLPVAVEATEVSEAAERFAVACRTRGISWPLVRTVVIGAEQFNELTERAASKGAVLAHGLTQLLRAAWPQLEGTTETVRVAIDKHGGRNTYAAMLQDAFPDGMILVQEESRLRSRYCLAGLPCDVQLTFQPCADSEHFCVALASMVSKYLREVLMLEFNQFWERHIPGLRPTAGYPGDATRYWEAISPVAAKLGLAEEKIWRRR